MNIQRNAVAARDTLNFLQVKSSPLLRSEAYQVLLDYRDPVSVGSVTQDLLGDLQAAQEKKTAISYNQFFFASTTAFAATGVLSAASTGNPLLASLFGLVTAGLGFKSFQEHQESKKAKAEIKLINACIKDTERAADQVASSLVSEGPEPGLITDRRYNPKGIITDLSTVYSQDTGKLLRTQVALGTQIPRKIEANAEDEKTARSPFVLPKEM